MTQGQLTQPDHAPQAQTLPSVRPFTNSPMVSLREQSESTILAAIHSPNDPGETLRRINTALSMGYDPDFDPQTKADIREEFLRALLAFPQWAIHQAFDQWTRTMTRRPSPAEIIIIIGRALQPMHDEIRRRKAEADRLADEKARIELTPEEIAHRRKVSAEILAGTKFQTRPDYRSANRRESIEPGEIAATMDLINHNAAMRQAQADHRAAVAAEAARFEETTPPNT